MVSMSPAKALMDEFAAEAKRLKNEQQYEAASAFDNAESLVNNIMHGEPFDDVASRVRAALIYNSMHRVLDPVQQQAYLAAVELLDTFVAVRQLELEA